MPIIPSDDTIITEDEIYVKEQLRKALGNLHDTEIVVVVLWVLVGLTQQEIGDIIGLSRASVWSVKEEAFRQLREQLKDINIA